MSKIADTFALFANWYSSVQRRHASGLLFPGRGKGRRNEGGRGRGRKRKEGRKRKRKRKEGRGRKEALKKQNLHTGVRKKKRTVLRRFLGGALQGAQKLGDRDRIAGCQMLLLFRLDGDYETKSDP